jgi:hypothetical protein
MYAQVDTTVPFALVACSRVVGTGCGQEKDKSCCGCDYCDHMVRHADTQTRRHADTQIASRRDADTQITRRQHTRTSHTQIDKNAFAPVETLIFQRILSAGCTDVAGRGLVVDVGVNMGVSIQRGSRPVCLRRGHTRDAVHCTTDAAQHVSIICAVPT